LERFEWNEEKERKNAAKHGVNFLVASRAFYDPLRIIAVDELHSEAEPRQFCIGKVDERIILLEKWTGVI